VLLIGLHGPLGSGKNTAADFISEWGEARGLLVVQRGFADLLKWSTARIFFPGISLDEGVAWANEAKWDAEITLLDKTGHDRWFKEITGRQLLQHNGPEAHRDVFGYDFWVDALLPLAGMAPPYNTVWHRNFQRDGETADIALINDLRFPNEAQRIHDLDGYVWEIYRPASEDRQQHASEQQLPRELIDKTLDNDASLEAFERVIMDVMTDFTRYMEWNK